MHPFVTLFSITTVLLVTQLPAQAQTWEVLPNSPWADDRWDAMSWADRDTGWIAGTMSGLYRTTNGGYSWEWQMESIIPGGSQNTFRSLAAIPSGHVWVGLLGGDTHLMHSTDNGQSWDKLRLDPTAGFNGVCGIAALDQQTMYCVGPFSKRIFGPPHFTVTRDAGATLTSVDLSEHCSTLVDIAFFDHEIGLVGGGSGEPNDGNAVILRTTDGGASWSNVYTGQFTRTQVWKFHVGSAGEVWAAVQGLAGAVPYVVVSRDSGRTWSDRVVTIDSTDGFNGMQTVGFTSDSIGWVAGRGFSAWRTDDDGETWLKDSTQLWNVNRFQFFGDTLGYAAGRRVYKLVNTSTSVSVGSKAVRDDHLTIDVQVTGDGLHIRSLLEVPIIEAWLYQLDGTRIGQQHASASGAHELHLPAGDLHGVYGVVVLTQTDYVQRLVWLP